MKSFEVGQLIKFKSDDKICIYPHTVSDKCCAGNDCKGRIVAVKDAVALVLDIAADDLLICTSEFVGWTGLYNVKII